MRRPQLDKAIEALGTGDVLVLAEWDRVTRSMLDGIKIIERVAARGATFKALDRKWLDLTTPIGRGILAFLSSRAKDERARILARANGGRAAASPRVAIGVDTPRSAQVATSVDHMAQRAIATPKDDPSCVDSNLRRRHAAGAP